GAAPSGEAAAMSSITAGEQQILCIVAARTALGPAEAHGFDATIATDEDAPAMRPNVGVARPYGADLRRLADGPLVAVLRPEGAATDRVVQAARLAVALRARLPDAPIVVATGRGLIAARVPVGEVIDVAARLLDRAASDGRAGGAVRLDEVT